MKEYKEKLKVGVPSEDVYAALTTPFALRIWTGGEVEFTAAAGSEFSLFDGEVTGRVLGVREGAMLRERWYFGDEELPDDAPTASIATIFIERLSGVRSEVTVRHTNIPDEAYENIAMGWHEVLLPSLREFLEAPE